MIRIIRKLEDYKDVESMKKAFFKSVEEITPEEIKDKPLIDLSNKGKIKLNLTKELVEKWKLDEWLANYKKEAHVSTGGIRGVQNILYCWDTRFPIHQLGVALATLGKALVLKDKIKDRQINKIASSEVRYNSQHYVELISRIQAAQGIKTHRPFKDKNTTIFMTSYLVFTHDYDGGEYATSSHAISRKIATKDLDSQGSQFMPEMSLEFVAKIEEIIEKAKNDGYTIELSEKDDPLIVHDFDGFDEYTEYLKNGVATETSINLINEAVSKGLKIMVECVGGSFYHNATNLFKRLGILETFDWCNIEEDPFFHAVGKTWVGGELIDYGCDSSLERVQVTMGYEKILADKPVGYTVLIADPDSDRLITGQVEPVERAEKLKELGIHFIKLGDDRVFVFYTPNQSFFFTMDYQMKYLKKASFWDNHPRFMIKTTASAIYWDRWAAANNIKVVDVPVGFKEIATMMKKIEKQISESKEVVVHDVYGNKINIGKDPRMVFAGEESGGMITGPEKLIKSRKGRIAVAMREKSDGEAAVLETALIADLFLQKKFLSEYFEQIFEENNIKERFDILMDPILYNENEPDPEILKREKAEGEKLRDEIDKCFLSICLGLKDNIITFDNAKEILSEMMPTLDFSDLEYVKFVGDGTYFRFKHKFVEVRKSGTDAKFKTYGGGEDQDEMKKYVAGISDFKGEKGKLFRKYISDEFCDNVIEKARKLYMEYLHMT